MGRLYLNLPEAKAGDYEEAGNDAYLVTDDWILYVVRGKKRELQVLFKADLEIKLCSLLSKDLFVFLADSLKKDFVFYRDY